jgi:hypothetical protein
LAVTLEAEGSSPFALALPACGGDVLRHELARHVRAKSNAQADSMADSQL